MIIRTGRRLPGVRPIGGIHAPISIVRMAVDDAYGAVERREGSGLDEVAWRTEHISRRTCRAVAEFAFLQARRTNDAVYGGPKWTVSPVYEGMMKEELDAAAERHRDVRYRPVLIDAAYAGLITHTGDALVVPALNRDGDCLSDMVLQLFGSIAGAESLLLAFDDDLKTTTVMAEAPHGTAPSLEGKRHRQPAGDDPRGRRVLRLVPDHRPRRRSPLARSTRRRSKPSGRRQDPGPRWPRAPPSSPTRSSSDCAPSSMSGRRCEAFYPPLATRLESSSFAGFLVYLCSPPERRFCKISCRTPVLSEPLPSLPNICST